MVAAGVFVPAGLEALYVAAPMAAFNSWAGVRVMPLEGGTSAVSEHSLMSGVADSSASIAGPLDNSLFPFRAENVMPYVLMTAMPYLQLKA